MYNFCKNAAIIPSEIDVLPGKIKVKTNIRVFQHVEQLNKVKKTSKMPCN